MTRIKYLITHIFQYSFVFLILATAIVSLFLLDNTHLKRTAVVAVASLYPLWGIIHHWEAKTLSAEIVLEYLAFTILILWTLLVTVR
ncbi:hypothetical protein KJ596_04670 [Patescibacteria group bacterium]|nr:hypothetical protein [Patescibacteria group bacterium]MBU1868613.1 hypothetical protein [Patescibacteria group bacterium]